MRISRKATLALGFGFALSTALSACGKKKNDDDDEDEEAAGGVPTASGNGSSSGLATADDVSDLKLSGLTVTLPGALDAEAGSGLRLLAGKKSADACMMGQSIKEVSSRLDSIAGFACHIEVEKDKIVFGKKYKITVQGQEFGRVLVEKSTDKITFANCMSGDHVGSELITITSLTETGPAGSIYSTNEDDGHSSVEYLTFDLSAAGKKLLAAKQQHSQGTNLFRRFVDLALVDSGISVASLASNGTWQGDSFSQRGAAKFDGTFGSTLFQSTGTHQGNAFTWANRGYFSQDGDTVAASASPDYASGGLLHIAATEVPEFLASDEAIPTADGWVGGGCADFDEEIELDPASAAHNACDSDHNGEHANCWGEDFEQGEQTSDL